MNTKEAAEQRQLTIKLQAPAIASGRWQCCLNCEHWRGPPIDKSQLGCDLFKALPPPHIIVSGCDQHLDNIPF